MEPAHHTGEPHPLPCQRGWCVQLRRLQHPRICGAFRHARQGIQLHQGGELPAQPKRAGLCVCRQGDVDRRNQRKRGGADFCLSGRTLANHRLQI